jgi:acetyl esterase/lipase
MRKLAALALTLGMAAAMTPAVATPGRPSHEWSARQQARTWAGRYTLKVDGQVAKGWLAFPRDRKPDSMLVFGHGCCGHPKQLDFVRTWADRYHAVVVAMDYRGDGHWDVWKGHRDTLAATHRAKRMFPSVKRTVLWGVSMGGEVTGMALARRPDLYDFWVDTMGVSDLTQQYVSFGRYGARNDNGSPDPAESWIVRETGGTPVTKTAAYEIRSPAYLLSFLRGVKRVYIAHGIGDPVVAYSQSRLLYERLAANGTPVSLYTSISGKGDMQIPRWGAGGQYMQSDYGLAPHDQRGFGPTFSIVHALLGGRVPDAGYGATEHVIDQTTGFRF